MPIDPGSLNKKIIIQRKAAGRSAMGAESGAWATYNTVWAKRKDLNPRESWEADGAGKVEAQTLVDWLVQSTSQTTGVTSKDRISDGGQIFEILTVQTVGDDVIKFFSRLRTN